MSVVFVVSSEEQLACGAAWCARLAEQHHWPVYVAVVGTDRKTLTESARRKVSELVEPSGEKTAAAAVEAEVQAVLDYIASVSGKIVLMVHREGNQEFQQSLFEQSPERTIWLAAHDPASQRLPQSSADVYSMFRRPSLMTTIAAEQVLRITPAETLCDELDFEQDDLVAAVNSALQAKQLGSGQLVLCGVERSGEGKRILEAGVTLLGEASEATIALVHNGDTFTESIAVEIHRWAASVAPPMQREQRIDLAKDLESGSTPNLEFLGLMSASSMLAAFGLLQDSAAVIIGAMLIAPLMTPILGAGLALTQGNRPLFKSAVGTVFMGFFGALVASMLFGWLFLLFQEPHITSEMWARCRPSPLDFCVGMVGGIAASYARTRSHLSSALAGAAIAAALVPPIATAGLQIAFGFWQESDSGVPIVGPLLLVSVNVLTIMIGSSFVLWARGMRKEQTPDLASRWTLRMFALLMTLALLILIWILHPFPPA